MKTILTLSIISIAIYTNNAIAQEQFQQQMTNPYLNNINIDNQSNTMYQGASNVTVVTNSDQMFDQINNINDNVQVQSMQVIAINNVVTGNRSNRSSTNVVNTDNSTSSNSNERKRTVLNKIEMPKPKPINVTSANTEIKMAKIDIDLSLTSDSKSKGRLIYVEKGFWKRNISNPIKGWFKRKFSRTKSFKAKLTCCFQN